MVASTNINNKNFNVWSDQTKERLDCWFHQPHFSKAIKTIKKSKYPTKPLSDMSSAIVNFGAYSLCNYIEWVNKGVPYVRIENLSEDGIRWAKIKKITPNVHDILWKSKLKKNDVLISMAGTIGLSTVFNETFECNSNQAIAKIRLKSDINPHFVSIFLNTEIGKLQSHRISNGAVQLNINLGEIGTMLIPIPPRTIQKRVVQTIQSAYKIKNKKLNKADEVLNSISHYVRDKLGIDYIELEEEKTYTVNSQNLQDNRHNPYYHNPKFATVIKQVKKGKYKVTTLGKYIEDIKYGASVKNVYVDKGIPLLRILNLTPNKIDLTNVVQLPLSKNKEVGNAYVKEGDFLVSRSGTIGVVAVVPKEADGFAYGSFMIKFGLSGKLDNKYVSIWLNSDISQMLIKREKIGAIQGNITIPTIQSFLIPVPPIAKQRKIAEAVTSKYKQVEKLKAEAQSTIEEAKKKVEQMILN